MSFKILVRRLNKYLIKKIKNQCKRIYSIILFTIDRSFYHSFPGRKKFFHPTFHLTSEYFYRPFSVRIHFQLATILLSDSFETSPFWRRKDYKRLIALCWVNIHGFTDAHAVFMSYVMVLPQLLVLKKLGLYLPVHLLDIFIDLLLLFCHLLVFSSQLIDILLQIRTIVSPNPLYSVLLKLFYIVNPLKDICDIVNTSLLYF